MNCYVGVGLTSDDLTASTCEEPITCSVAWTLQKGATEAQLNLYDEGCTLLSRIFIPRAAESVIELVICKQWAGTTALQGSPYAKRSK